MIMLPVLAILALLPGCYTAALLEYDALKPADVNIPSSVRSLVVVPRCDLDSANRQSLILSGKKSNFELDSMMAKSIVNGCADALLESPRFTLFNPLIKRSLSEDFTIPSYTLPWSVIRSVAGDPPHDGVLSFESGTISDSLFHEYEDGWLSNYQYQVVIKSFWRLYRLSDFQSKEFRFTDTVSFFLESRAEFVSDPSIRIEFISNALYESGLRTAKRLAPWWDICDRNYFRLGPSAFAKGANDLKQGKWKEAAEIYRPYTGSKNKMIAAKACFNMAVTSEMANNIPAALEWLAKSKQLGMLPGYIIIYQPMLEKRKAELERLNQQMK
jgi:hypothetical protein